MTENNRIFSNKALAALFIPLVLEQALSYSVGLIDSMMVASLGEAAVSGVALMDFIMTLLISLFSALATGGAVIAGQYLGRKDNSTAQKVANQMIKTILWFSIGIALLVFLLRNVIFDILYSNIALDVKDAAYTYLMVVICSVPFLGLYNGLAAVFRVMGNSKLPMKVMLGMNILNIIGNAVFVFVFHMGVFGIALSTLIARIGSAVILYVLCKKPDLMLSMDSPFVTASDISMVKQILSIGIPYGLENCMFNLGKLFLTSLMSSFGTASIAANSIGGSLGMFQILAGTSIGLGLTTVISQCIGAGDVLQARYYVKKVFTIIYISHFVCTAAIFGIMPLLLKIYDLSAEGVKLLIIYLLLHGISSFTIWPFANSMPIVFRSAGNAKFSMTVSTTTMILCRIVLAYVYSLVLNWGVIGIWAAMVSDWVVKGLIYMWHYFSNGWLKKQV